jgi:predicted nucleotide-binding protein
MTKKPSPKKPQLKDTKPIVFIGSSTEGKTVAQHLHSGLGDFCSPRLWDRLDSFTLSASTWDNLVRHALEVQFAVMLFTPDDRLYSRKKVDLVARDNVILELGLFMGALGTKRVFVLHPERKPPKLPSDLVGLTTARYDETESSIQNALMTPILQIKDAISRELEHDNRTPKLSNVLGRIAMKLVDQYPESITLDDLDDLLETKGIRGDLHNQLSTELKRRQRSIQ